MNFFRSFFSTSTAAMSEASKQKVQQLINDNAVVVFSKSYCPYCSQTKSTLRSFDAKAEVLELDNLEDGSDLQAALQAITGQRTVPNIFIAKKHIGGNSDLQALASDGNLKTMLQDAGAL
ncbi:glutaredoxin [Stachybotrys elegans]|uniref:Glutaredoxin n=1 Tax=Stachybotrys elegans TaxID=80388 RepID=A0A8K0WPS1_9HYPO|nr:glutaredoxin [Stachybotrys elegans]